MAGRHAARDGEDSHVRREEEQAPKRGRAKMPRFRWSKDDGTVGSHGGADSSSETTQWLKDLGSIPPHSTVENTRIRWDYRIEQNTNEYGWILIEEGFSTASYNDEVEAANAIIGDWFTWRGVGWDMWRYYRIRLRPLSEPGWDRAVLVEGES